MIAKRQRRFCGVVERFAGADTENRNDSFVRIDFSSFCFVCLCVASKCACAEDYTDMETGVM